MDLICPHPPIRPTLQNTSLHHLITRPASRRLLSRGRARRTAGTAAHPVDRVDDAGADPVDTCGAPIHRHALTCDRRAVGSTDLYAAPPPARAAGRTWQRPRSRGTVTWGRTRRQDGRDMPTNTAGPARLRRRSRGEPKLRSCHQRDRLSR